MSDASDNSQTVPAGAVPVRFLGQFIRDLSFEVPHAPEIFNEMRQRAPDIPLSFDMGARHLGGPNFEVVMNVNLQAAIGDKPAFILELAYAAIVEVNPELVPAEQLHPVLLIEIPRFLFPFVRQIVGDLTVGGGFPPLHLQMLDFVDIYRRKFGNEPQTIDLLPAQA